MKALVHTEPFRLEYTHVPAPELGPEDVLVRVRACGICGSDVAGYTGKTGRRIPPIIMGHEAAGIVEEAGPDVPPGFPNGRVCFDSTVFCNRCAACKAGRVNRCRRREVLGVSVPGMKRHGAMAEFVRVPWWTLVPMPEQLSFESAALLEPVAIALHAVRRAGDLSGKTVFILGAGTIGLLILQAARLGGAGRTVVADLNDHRLRTARELGADVAFSPRAERLADFVKEGAEVSFEAVGLATTLQEAVAGTRAGGLVVLVGNLTQQVALDVPDIVSRELTLRGTYCSAGEYRDAVRLVAAQDIRLDPLLSAAVPLSDGQRAFDRLRGGAEKDLVKIVLVPQGSQGGVSGSAASRSAISVS